MKRPRFFCLSILIAAAVVAVAGAQDPPPGDLHLEGDHWTAWNPPSEIPEGVQVHVVQPGDTFWSIAQEYLGDPHLWPQIWEQNQWVLDSHWIYPGDPLLLAGTAVADAYVESEDVMAPPLDEAMVADEGFPGAGDQAPLDSSTYGIADPEPTAPVPLGHESDIYCTGYIGDEDEVFPFHIAASEYDFLSPQLDIRQSSNLEGEFGKAETEKFGLGLGDIVYIEGGRADGLSAGELLTAVDRRKVLRHPRTRERLGRVYQYLGRLRVLSTQTDTSIAEVTELCAPMPVGTSLKYFEPEPIPLRRMTPMRPVNYPARAEDLEGAPTIIGSIEGQTTGLDLVTLGTGYLVLIDNGAAQDVAPGDIYTIYRFGRRGFPPIVLGELGVLSVFENTSLARILRSRYAIYIGDPLQSK